MKENETYLGDGLYASFDGYQFELRAPRGYTHDVVYLDWSTYHAFKEYAEAKLTEQKLLREHP